MSEQRYTMFNSPAHGWLKVPISELEKMGIKNQISEYSYVGEEFAYLEEDRDMTIFIHALEIFTQKIWDWKNVISKDIGLQTCFQ